MQTNLLVFGLALLAATLLIRFFAHKSRLLDKIRRDKFPHLFAWGLVALGIGILSGTDFTRTETQSAMMVAGFILMLIAPRGSKEGE